MVKKINFIFVIILIALISGCSLAPGMHMTTQNQGGKNFVYIENLDTDIEVKSISNNTNNNDTTVLYKIGNGDQIAITVWGLPEIFPIANMNPDQNLRRVDSNGDIYFPYVGSIGASGKTQNQLRDDLSSQLSEFFNDPQLDVTIARFNSQKVYLLGEVTRPKKLNITDVPLSLAEALGEADGLNTNTSNGSEVFIIRRGTKEKLPQIYRANLSSPAEFINAGNFYLSDDDIIYVNAKGTTRWNKVISQFFPFSSFLNSVENLTNND